MTSLNPRLVPSDKEKAIAEELIQHEVPAKLATLAALQPRAGVA